jgi:hypothetical protein
LSGTGHYISDPKSGEEIVGVPVLVYVPDAEGIDPEILTGGGAGDGSQDGAILS